MMQGRESGAKKGQDADSHSGSGKEGTPLPLSGLSVFVSANEQHGTTADEECGDGQRSVASTSQAGVLMNSSTGASPSPKSVTTTSPAPFSPATPKLRTSFSFNRTRRNRAHQPILLGMDEESQINDLFKDGSEEANEAVMLTGLGVHASPTATSTKRNGRRRSGPSHALDEREEQHQFRITADSDDDDDNENDEHEVDIRGSTGRADTKEARSSNDRTSSSHHTRSRESSHKYSAFEEDEDEVETFPHAGMNGRSIDLEAQAYRDDDEEEEGDGDYDDDDDGMQRAYKLPFEQITRREQVWMWTSVLFVAALSIVSIAIAVDWIDWPGDGIGQS